MWSKERAWAWYDAHPWIRGCNYMSADCANYVDQWQSLGFDERLETTDRELALAASIGFNSIRILVDFLVWEQEHDTFFGRFDRYLDVCAKHGISCTVVLANDCVRPKGIGTPHLGEQHVDWGYHGGRRLSQHGKLGGMGHHVLDDPETAPRFLEMVREIVEHCKNDERVLLWNVYNEVGNCGRRDVTLPNLKRIFDICREIDPIQPLTCESWQIQGDLEALPEVERYALEQSDIITYHSYSDYATNVKIIRALRTFGRPIMCTEWLARCLGSNVQELFPLFYLEKIGCYNWGFVAGKYQTYEPWNAVWEQYEEDPGLKWDFTKWFHDLYRPSHRPYDPREIEIIKTFCALADRDFSAAAGQRTPSVPRPDLETR